jgi:hypothetical protein
VGTGEVKSRISQLECVWRYSRQRMVWNRRQDVLQDREEESKAR